MKPANLTLLLNRGAAALLLLLAACAEPRTGGVDEVAPPRESTGRLPDLAFPKAYRLRLQVPPKSNRFWGTAAIDLGVPRPTRWVVLHARGLKITAVSVEDRDGRVQHGRWHVRSAWDFKVEPDELVLSFEEPIADGATLTIDYEGAYGNDARGMYRAEAGGASVVLTQFEPTDARAVFPCFDEPRYRTPFEITVAVPKGSQAFSNAPLARIAPRRRGDAYVSYEFSPTPPLPTYLVAVAAGRFEVTSGRSGSTPLRLVTPAGLEFSPSAQPLETAADELAILERLLGEAYPFAKLDLLAAPRMDVGAMEHPGLVTVHAGTLLLGPDAGEAGRAVHEEVVAHELAHMWFGNWVSPVDWSDMWLNEGLASWMALRVMEERSPELAPGLSSVARTSSAMDADALPAARAMRHPADSVTAAQETFDELLYHKGGALMSMLESYAGPDITRRALAAYLSAHRFETATTRDLLSAFDSAAGRDVTSWMAGFLERAGVPVVTASLDCTAGPVVVLHQDGDWQPPLCVRYGASEGSQTTCTLLTGAATRVALPGTECPGWVYPNADQRGYYRVRLSDEPVRALAAARARLTPREQLGLLLEAQRSLADGHLGAATYVDLLRSFHGAPQRQIWAEIVGALSWLSDLAAPTPARTAIRDVAHALLQREVEASGGDGARGGMEDDSPPGSEKERALRWGLGRVGEDAAMGKTSHLQFDRRALPSAFDSAPSNMAGSV